MVFMTFQPLQQKLFVLFTLDACILYLKHLESIPTFKESVFILYFYDGYSTKGNQIELQVK